MEANLTTQVHTLGFRLDEAWATWFGDGVEVLKRPSYFHADMLKAGLKWYPIMNVGDGADFIGHPAAYADGLATWCSPA